MGYYNKEGEVGKEGLVKGVQEKRSMTESQGELEGKKNGEEGSRHLEKGKTKDKHTKSWPQQDEAQKETVEKRVHKRRYIFFGYCDMKSRFGELLKLVNG